MNDTNPTPAVSTDPEHVPPLDYVFEHATTRRAFVTALGAGLMIAVAAPDAPAQQRPGRRGGGGGGGDGRPVSARVHIARDGTVTVLTGKIEMGQNARGEITQAAAEELRLPPEQVRLLMADTSLVPDDGLSAGSRTTPYTLPPVRQGAAAARILLVNLAAKSWNVDPASLAVRDGRITHAPTNRTLTYADLARDGAAESTLAQAAPPDITLTPVAEWQVMGKPFARPNRRDLVSGAHQYPSDIARPGMWYGKILRPPSYNARLVSIDTADAKALKDVVIVQDGAFVGVAAPTTFRAEQALAALAAKAKWEPAPHPSSQEVHAYLRRSAQVPANPFADEKVSASKSLKQTYTLAYVQHTPMEPRAAVAEWTDGRLTVWSGTQNPFGYHGELARAFRLPNDRVRVIVPDFGCGYGGKHTGECAIEAARLAQAANRPVSVRWTRAEEFTWAYFRPAAVIDAEATLDPQGRLTSWHFVNINAGGAAVDTPYRIAKSQCRSVGANSPLRQGSYRTLAATGNTFARECFMDELAAAAGMDALDFRLANLENPRLRAVLEAAAERFNWHDAVRRKSANIGVGLACGTEKGSYVAACVEIAVEPENDRIIVKRICQVFECGAIVNPRNLMAQNHSCLIMGLGPALREEMRFANGKVANATFTRYLVPRFADVPELDIHFLNRPDLPSVGGGETPIIAVAPAIANALFRATGQRIRQMPIRSNQNPKA